MFQIDKKVNKIIFTIISSLVTLTIGIILGFVLPKVMNFEDYRNYKIYSFYIGFLGIFHFGINDAIVIKYSSLSKDELENTNVGRIVLVQTLLSLIISIVLLIINLYLNGPVVYTYVILSITPLILYIIISQLFRINLRVKWMALYNMFGKVLLVLVIIVYVILKDTELAFVLDYKLLIYATIVSEIILVTLGLLLYRRLFFRIGKVKNILSDYKMLVYLGLPSILAVFIGNLATGLDKIFIEHNNSIEDYAYYAFAFSMLQVVIGVIMSSSSIILPMLSRTTIEKQNKIYSNITKGINIFAIGAGIGLVFVPVIIDKILPSYIGSITVFILIFPIAIYSVQYNMKHRQYFFLHKKSGVNFIVNILLLIIVFILNVVVLKFNLSFHYYAIATLISYAIWNLILEIIFAKYNGYTLITDVLVSTFFSIIIVFYALYYHNLIASFVYCVFLIGLIVIFYRKSLKTVIIGFKNRIRGK